MTTTPSGIAPGGVVSRSGLVPRGEHESMRTGYERGANAARDVTHRFAAVIRQPFARIRVRHDDKVTHGVPMKRRHLLLLTLSLLAVVPLATTHAQAIVPGCDKEATTSFRFGHTAGNLMPSVIEVTAAGAVRHRGDESAGPTLGHVPRKTVLALARRAWRGGFGALPPAPTHPTRNPDAARQFIELHSACGFHHVEYGPGDESPLFRELYARLTAITAPSLRGRR
jgi:hypothetical protein